MVRAGRPPAAITLSASLARSVMAWSVVARAIAISLAARERALAIPGRALSILRIA
ncbi:MAG: hypothetical protein WCQ50_15590 [Spirochaetota bacterium]